MWSAIQSDLFEFVSTVQADTNKTLKSVLGASPEDDEEDLQKRQLRDLQRSFNTYNEPIDESSRKEFQKFRNSFTLSSQAVEIGNILDEEPDVPRYYAELVPAKMVPEEFWGRYFFKLDILLRGAAPALDVLDEDEEIGWDTNDGPTDSAVPPMVSVEAGVPSAVSSTASLSSMSIADSEKDIMRKQIRALVARVSELEKALAASNAELMVCKQEGHNAQIIGESPMVSVAVAVAAPNSFHEEIIGDPSPLSDSSPVEISDSAMSPFDSGTSDTGSRSLKATEAVGDEEKAVEKKTETAEAHSKSENSLANLDDEEWEDENGWS